MKTAANKDDGYIPLKDRFMAWWEGVDSRALAKRDTDKPQESGIDLDDVEEYFAWTPSRIQLNHKIWGDGHVSPSNGVYTMDMLRPAAIDPTQSILDLNAGLGGGACAIAEYYQIVVDAMEPVDELAHAANAFARSRQLQDRVRVEDYKPEALALGRQRFNCIYARELFHRIDNKEGFLNAVYSGMKESGSLVFTDYMIPEKVAEDESAIADWKKNEPDPIYPWKVSQYRAVLRRMGFESRSFNDDTENFRGRIMDGLKECIAKLRPEDLNREVVTTLMRVAQIWRGRAKILDSGFVKLYQVHVVRKRKIV